MLRHGFHLARAHPEDLAGPEESIEDKRVTDLNKTGAQLPCLLDTISVISIPLCPDIAASLKPNSYPFSNIEVSGAWPLLLDEGPCQDPSRIAQV